MQVQSNWDGAITPSPRKTDVTYNPTALSFQWYPNEAVPAEHEALGLTLAHAVGALIMAIIASAVAWRVWTFWSVADARAAVVVSIAAYLAAALATARITSLPRSTPFGAILISTTISFVAALAGLASLGLPYSRLYLSCAWVLATVCQAAAYGVQPHVYPRFAVLPGKLTERLRSVPGASWIPVEHVEELEVDAVVLDPMTASSPEWTAALAAWKFNGQKLVDARAVYELFTGRVLLDRAYSSQLEFAQLRTVYGRVRRALELTGLLLTLPIVLPLVFLVALAIRLDSAGPVIFRQQRMGLRGKPFRMCKFRTMRADSEQSGARFATVEDRRVTRIGKFLRKSRLDELPQLWNVVRGEMSVIGPRPEQMTFARKFEQEMPGYTYRHLVRPGITGWAQVNQGYAANSDETRTKLEYDLYYVKNLSPWLDASVVLKTVQTIVTGFGAR